MHCGVHVYVVTKLVERLCPGYLVDNILKDVDTWVSCIIPPEDPFYMIPCRMRIVLFKHLHYIRCWALPGGAGRWQKERAWYVLFIVHELLLGHGFINS